MRIVLLNETYSPKMGYSENALSKALVKLGADVHLVVSHLPPYYNLPDFKETYGNFIDKEYPKNGNEVDGYHIHYLPHKKLFGYLRLKGLIKKLRELNPDIVQTFSVISWIPLEAAIGHIFQNYKLFTANHTTASVFPLARRNSNWWNRELIKSFFTRFISGRFISLWTNKCYPATVDCADVAVRFFGVQQKKIEVSTLGVDLEIFFPNLDMNTFEKREMLRQTLGFKENEIVCIYTGRFTVEKNPLLLAQAISTLKARGENYRGLFIGDGIQKLPIQELDGCVVIPFLPFTDLGDYFRASDIGVWPTQESMSMLDAAGCGIPIIVNDTLVAKERVEGNGLIYHLNDLEDLILTLLKMRSPIVRKQLGDFGAAKIRSQFSWDSIADRRIKDYESVIRNGKKYQKTQ